MLRTNASGFSLASTASLEVWLITRSLISFSPSDPADLANPAICSSSSPRGSRKRASSLVVSFTA